MYDVEYTTYSLTSYYCTVTLLVFTIIIIRIYLADLHLNGPLAARLLRRTGGQGQLLLLLLLLLQCRNP